jgi:hypothetical protein
MLLNCDLIKFLLSLQSHLQFWEKVKVRKVIVSLKFPWRSWCTLIWFCFSSIERLGADFAEVCCMFRFCVCCMFRTCMKTLWYDQNGIPISLTELHIVVCVFQWTNSFTYTSSSPDLHMDGCSEFSDIQSILVHSGVEFCPLLSLPKQVLTFVDFGSNFAFLEAELNTHILFLEMCQHVCKVMAFFPHLLLEGCWYYNFPLWVHIVRSLSLPALQIYHQIMIIWWVLCLCSLHSLLSVLVFRI